MILLLYILIIIRCFFLQPFVVPSRSMETTLLVGDSFFATKYDYGIHLPFVVAEVVATGEPKIGDVIVFPQPLNPKINYVKRVVALPGDLVEMRDKRFFRNGQLVHESYVIHADPAVNKTRRDNMPPYFVARGKVFVMGDNRDNSEDSRHWGAVDKSSIIGRAWIIYGSLRSERVGRRVE